MSAGARIREILGLGAALQAASEHGVLVGLLEAPGTLDELALRLGLDRRALGRVLDVLVAFDAAAREGERFVASDDLRAWARGSAAGAALELSLWRSASGWLSSGESSFSSLTAPGDPGLYPQVVQTLAANAEASARGLADRLGLRPRRVLDIGCGAGAWSLAFAERTLDARVTGLDHQDVLPAFSARAAALGLKDRVEALPGDARTAELREGGYDLVVVANVLRLGEAAFAREVLRSAAKACAEDGSILVIDALARGTPKAERARAVYALHLALRSRAGTVHAPEDVQAWMRDLGFPRSRPLPLDDGAAGHGALLFQR